MKKAYHLGNCNTCQRILDELNWDGERQEIRSEKITESQLYEMAQMAGSYESLFSRRAIKYKTMGLKDRALKETDYKSLILEEDTFLKRPIFIIDQEIFIGNSKKVVEAVQQAL
jgi:arsenate reductase